MKAHSSTILNRAIQAALRTECEYRVVAVGYDFRGRIIGIATNSLRIPTRNWHAEERLLFKSPRSLKKITIARVSHDGKLLPIRACSSCSRLAEKRGVTIEVMEEN